MANVEELTEELDPEAVRVGAALRELRQTHGWTLERLGTAIGKTHSYLSKIENGHLAAKVPLCRDIARAYGLSPVVVVALVFGTPDDRPTTG